MSLKIFQHTHSISMLNKSYFKKVSIYVGSSRDGLHVGTSLFYFLDLSREQAECIKIPSISISSTKKNGKFMKNRAQEKSQHPSTSLI